MCGASRPAGIAASRSGEPENSTGQARGIFGGGRFGEGSGEPENSTGQARGFFSAIGDLFVDATGLSRGVSRLLLALAATLTQRCHGLAPWSFHVHRYRHSPWRVKAAQKCGDCQRLSFNIETCAARRAAAGGRPSFNIAS